MKNIKLFWSAKFLVLSVVILSACQVDPFEGIVSNERAITAFKLNKGQVGVSEISRTPDKGEIVVYVAPNTDLTNISADTIGFSYKASVIPAAGETIDLSDSTYTFTVTAESGMTREWTIVVKPFVEYLDGTVNIAGMEVYGGTGPEWGGGAVMPIMEKHWIWSETDGPSADFDNELIFEFEGVNEDGSVTYGTLIHNPGPDGIYADYQYVLDPPTDEEAPLDLNHFYRKIPKGESKWERNYTTNTITFVSSNGEVSSASMVVGNEDPDDNEEEIVVYKDDNRTIYKVLAPGQRALEFELVGTDAWDHIFTDYDKFAANPRLLWIEIIKGD